MKDMRDLCVKASEGIEAALGLGHCFFLFFGEIYLFLHPSAPFCQNKKTMCIACELKEAGQKEI